jgi:hypothetical protein
MRGVNGARAASRGRPWWHLALLCWASLGAAFVIRLGGWAPDDFYITYRYARNLARGDGFVYNTGERVFGTSDPGIGLLLGGAHALTRIDVPVLAAILFAAGLVGVALVVLWRGDAARRLEALLGGTLLVTSTLFWSNQGAAAPVLLATLLAAAALAHQRPGVAGALAGAAAWLRPDALIALPLLAALRWVEERRVPWRLLATGIAAIGVGALAAWAWFGQPLPNTLGAKLDMASARTGAATGLAFWQRAAATQLPRHLGAGYALLLLAGCAGALAMLARGNRVERLLAAYGLAVAAAYTALGVPFFGWYLLPAYVALLYGLAWLAASVGRAIASRAGRARAAPLVASALLAALAWQPLAHSVELLATSHQPSQRLRSYRRAGEWIRAHSAPEETIAYVEIGVVGYYADRPLLDLMGLVSPQVRPFVQDRNLVGAFRRWPTDFVLHHSRGRMSGIVESRWFRQRYREVAAFPEPARSGRPPQVLRVYRRGRAEPTATAPPPAPISP